MGHSYLTVKSMTSPDRACLLPFFPVGFCDNFLYFGFEGTQVILYDIP